eukprot:jgi/Ulvmu1/4048/UM019_0025.1
MSSMAVRPSHGWVKQFAAKESASLRGAAADQQGILSGLNFVVKDMYEVASHANGCGNPTWLATHSTPATSSAPCVQALLGAGATLLGMSHMDELAYSLNGQNFHYGTPVNHAAPDRVPGGSSSGSASIVAWGEADFAVGSDTAGSVRIPASYQGIFGFRPTHGRISMAQAVPLAPSFDTCGWFARDAETLRKVGSALLAGSEAGDAGLDRWIVAKDAFAMAEEAAGAIYGRLSGRFEAVQELLGEPSEVSVSEGQGTLKEWLAVFKTLQASEVWASHGEWIQQHNPEFGPGVRERFEMASQITREEVAAALQERDRIRDHVDGIMGPMGFMAVPAAPHAAPRLDCGGPELEEFRTKALALTSIAGICGMPQVSLPLGQLPAGPVGMGLIGPRGSDEALLELAEKLSNVLEIGGPVQVLQQGVPNPADSGKSVRSGGKPRA